MHLPPVLVDLLAWFAGEVLPPAMVLAALGFLFREKWRQILSRSLSRELEGYKHELALLQAQHAASLTPQLEAVKHEFQQRLEAYKVSLIAEAEAAKLKTDVRKTVANRFIEIKFERLMEVDKCWRVCADFVLTATMQSVEMRKLEERGRAIELLGQWRDACAASEMFFPTEEQRLLYEATRRLQSLIEYIGGTEKLLSSDDLRWQDTLQVSVGIKALLQAKIRELAEV